MRFGNCWMSASLCLTAILCRHPVSVLCQHQLAGCVLGLIQGFSAGLVIVREPCRRNQEAEIAVVCDVLRFVVLDDHRVVQRLGQAAFVDQDGVHRRVVAPGADRRPRRIDDAVGPVVSDGGERLEVAEVGPRTRLGSTIVYAQVEDELVADRRNREAPQAFDALVVRLIDDQVVVQDGRCPPLDVVPIEVQEDAVVVVEPDGSADLVGVPAGDLDPAVHLARSGVDADDLTDQQVVVHNHDSAPFYSKGVVFLD